MRWHWLVPTLVVAVTLAAQEEGARQTGWTHSRYVAEQLIQVEMQVGAAHRSFLYALDEKADVAHELALEDAMLQTGEQPDRFVLTRVAKDGSQHLQIYDAVLALHAELDVPAGKTVRIGAGGLVLADEAAFGANSRPYRLRFVPDGAVGVDVSEPALELLAPFPAGDRLFGTVAQASSPSGSPTGSRVSESRYDLRLYDPDGHRLWQHDITDSPHPPVVQSVMAGATTFVGHGAKTPGVYHLHLLDASGHEYHTQEVEAFFAVQETPRAGRVLLLGRGSIQVYDIAARKVVSELFEVPELLAGPAVLHHPQDETLVLLVDGGDETRGVELEVVDLGDTTSVRRRIPVRATLAPVERAVMAARFDATGNLRLTFPDGVFVVAADLLRRER